MFPEIGSAAPSFSLKSTDNELVSLDDLKGSNTLLVFIPFPFTGICDGEVCLLRDGLADLAALDANVVVITCDTRPTNAEWSKQNGFTFPILSDFWPHGATAQAYGTFNEAVGSNNRVTFVLDSEGTVREVIATDSLGTPREYDEYVAALGRIG